MRDNTFTATELGNIFDELVFFRNHGCWQTTPKWLPEVRAEFNLSGPWAECQARGIMQERITRNERDWIPANFKEVF